MHNTVLSLTLPPTPPSLRVIHVCVCVCALKPAGVQPRQIGIIITNSSLFNTTPSLSATIMNHFKMSSKTLNYNLAGMGCSAGARLAGWLGGWVDGVGWGCGWVQVGGCLGF